MLLSRLMCSARFMRLALVADWLPTFAGAEHVVAALHDIWPSAPVFTTVVNRKRIGPLARADIRDTSLRLPYRLLGRHQPLLPWMPSVMENIDLSGYDVILSSSHAVGKGIVPPSDAVHVCYCHTPMRYAWEMEEDYLRDFGLSGFAASFARKQLKRLRRWDLSTAKRVDVFLANSSETQERIRRIYGRESIVIPPPVDDRFFATPLAADGGSYFLAVGRFVPYKRFDLLIDAANRSGFHLKIGGRGQDEKKLKKLAGPTVEFLGFVPDEKLPALYASARALMFPQLEDAGVVPIEAQASGTPVIALGKGGAVDSIRDGRTGLFFEEQTLEQLLSAVARFGAVSWDRSAIREHARDYSLHRFREKVTAEVERAVAQKRGKR